MDDGLEVWVSLAPGPLIGQTAVDAVYQGGLGDVMEAAQAAARVPLDWRAPAGYDPEAGNDRCGTWTADNGRGWRSLVPAVVTLARPR